ncbi:MAG TPA: 3-methyladenine DNA glycosylase [Pseudonocardiaceae bacterium]
MNNGLVVLDEGTWRSRAEAHRRRVRQWTEPHLRRRAAGEKHPVLDFLFTYYSHRPARLERWHPGPGVVLTGDSAREYLQWSGYHEVEEGVTLDPAAFTPNRRRTAEFVLALLTATSSRPPRLGCYGLHEWAMVYRLPEDQVRHRGVPLRLGSAGTDAVVESLRIRCSHFDAFRFFTEPARPRNTLQPSRESQLELEQPGCLHATMDLYKWCYKLEPFVPSELMADCFELAVQVRELDMQASPYDLSELGYQPVRVETPAGRAEFTRRQASFAAQAAPLRQHLIELCRELLSWDVNEPHAKYPNR